MTREEEGEKKSQKIEVHNSVPNLKLGIIDVSCAEEREEGRTAYCFTYYYYNYYFYYCCYSLLRFLPSFIHSLLPCLIAPEPGGQRSDWPLEKEGEREREKERGRERAATLALGISIAKGNHTRREDECKNMHVRVALWL